jgi:hypothetical protein
MYWRWVDCLELIRNQADHRRAQRKLMRLAADREDWAADLAELLAL